MTTCLHGLGCCCRVGDGPPELREPGPGRIIPDPTVFPPGVGPSVDVLTQRCKGETSMPSWLAQMCAMLGASWHEGLRAAAQAAPRGDLGASLPQKWRCRRCRPWARMWRPWACCTGLRP